MDIVRRIESMDRYLGSQAVHLLPAALIESTRAMTASIISSVRTARLAMDDASLIMEKVAASQSNGLPPPSR